MRCEETFGCLSGSRVECLEPRRLLSASLIGPLPEVGPGPAVVTIGEPGADFVVIVDVNPSPQATSPNKTTNGKVTISDFVVIKTTDKSTP